MRILLDSYVFVWAKCAPENLSDDARAALIDPANDVFVSVASAWELWIKHARKPMKELAPVLESGASGFLDAARESGIDVLDITLDHAAAAPLPPVHRDTNAPKSVFCATPASALVSPRDTGSAITARHP